METPPKERRHTSQHALIDSAIRSTKQLSASSDIMTRSLANRMFSELTQVRRALPNRRLHEAAAGETASIAHAAGSDAANRHVVDPKTTPHPAQPVAPVATPSTAWDDLDAVRDVQDSGASDWAFLMELHRSRTLHRLKAHAQVLCLHGDCGIDGEAPVHALYTVADGHAPLGLLDAWTDSKAAPTAEDQTAGAIRSYQMVAEMAAQAPSTRLAFVARLRFDLAPLVRQSQAHGVAADWLTIVGPESPLHADQALWRRARADAELGESDFALHTDYGCAPRILRARLWAKRMEIQSGGEKLWVTCLYGREVDLAPGDTATEWRLLSNRSAQDLAGAHELMQWCLSMAAFDHFARLMQHTRSFGGAPRVFDLIAGCRIAQLTEYALLDPEVDAHVFFSRDEMRAIDLLSKRQPSAEMCLADNLHQLAILGGVADRHADRDAQYAAIRCGLLRLSDAVAVLRRLPSPTHGQEPVLNRRG